MAKVTLTDLTSLANDTSAVNSINGNFTTLETELQTKVLYRDNPTGEPNSMQNDLDMNSNDILNASSISADTLTLGGTVVQPGDPLVGTQAEAKVLASGQTTVTFTNTIRYGSFYLSGPDVDNGRLRSGTDYTISGNTVTLSESYPAGTQLTLVYYEADANIANLYANEIQYTQGGTGSVYRTVENRLRETVSVKDFGAVGDGVTDDTAAIQAALDSGAGMVYFPSGTYSSGQLSVASNTTISFASDVVIDLITAPSNYTIFYIYQKDNVVIEGNGATLQMTKADYSGESNHGININESTNVKILNLKVKDCGGDGIYVGGIATQSTGFVIDGCTIDNCRRNGVSVVNGKNGVVKSSVFTNMLGALPEAGLDLEPNVGSIVENIVVSDCIAHSNNGDGFIMAFGPLHCSFADCFSYDNNGTGFNISSNGAAPSERIPTDNIVSGCSAFSNASTGIYVYYANETTISGSVSKENTGFGVQLQNTQNSKVIGCLVEANTSKGVALSTSTQDVISNCHVLYNAAGGIVTTGTNTGISISSNTLIGNYDLSGTYDANIYVLASNSLIQHNLIRKGGATNKPDYGIQIAGGSVALEIAGNDYDDGGLVSDLTGATSTTVGATKHAGWVQSGIGASNIGGFEVPYNPTQAASRTWRIKNDTLAFGDFAIQQATTAGGSTYSTHITVAASGGHFAPGTDNAQTNGTAAKRWSVVYAGTGAINTSDAREKTFLTIEDAEKAAALEIKANLRKFKFNDAITLKGDDARIHFGASAQQVGDILESHGLAKEAYAFFCYDEWEAEFDEDGNEVSPAGNRYGIRYEELLAFILAAM